MALAEMSALSDHGGDQEWHLVEDLGGDDLCGSSQTGPGLTVQKNGTRPPSSLKSVAVSNQNSQRPQSLVVPHCHTSLVSIHMAPNLTAQEVNEAREHDRMAGRVKSLAWTFGGVHKSDEHKNASSKSSDLVPHEYAEEDRQRLRANYLAWMFGGVHINNAHEDWDNLSSTDKEALRAKLAEGQQRSDEQVGMRIYDSFQFSHSPDDVARWTNCSKGSESSGALSRQAEAWNQCKSLKTVAQRTTGSRGYKSNVLA